MNRQFSAAVLGLVAALAPAAGFAADSANYGKTPPSELIVKRGNLEWVWASPAAFGDQSEWEGPDAETYRYSFPLLHSGFMVATDEQWLASFKDLAELQAAFTDVSGQQATCGASYFMLWSDYGHCDVGDLAIGAIWHAPSPIGLSYVNDPGAELFLVRAAVPEPGAYALAFAGLAVIGMRARKRRA